MHETHFLGGFTTSHMGKMSCVWTPLLVYLVNNMTLKKVHGKKALQ